ncbi:MAG: acyl-CoA dehydrogenase family protein [Thermodesulfobacteriota bacterium]
MVPREAGKKMGEQGFLAMNVPEEYGGPGADFLYSVIVTEELTRTNHSGLAASLHTDIIVPYILAFASEEQKQKYLPGCVSGDIITAIAMTEPNTGSLIGLVAFQPSPVDTGAVHSYVRVLRERIFHPKRVKKFGCTAGQVSERVIADHISSGRRGPGNRVTRPQRSFRLNDGRSCSQNHGVAPRTPPDETKGS